MRIIAFSCHNIWPFYDRTISVVFRHGRFLIKAPIGSGKSFLFFDGPLFALYKSNSRTILSTQAESGRVKILVEHDGKHIVCIRNLTRTKAGNDAVKSTIRVHDDTNALRPIDVSTPIIAHDTDVIEGILQQQWRENIPCKNETDAQGILEPFLPPEDVFLTTMFLLQDSKNIFDLVPAERIRLLKEIFWLISIDAATEKIQDEKKAVSAIIKSKEYTGDLDTKFQWYLQTLGQQLAALWKTHDPRIHACIEAIWYAEQQAILGGFTLENEWFDAIVAYQEQVQHTTNSLTQQLADIQSQENLIAERAREMSRLEDEIAKLDRSIAEVNGATIDAAQGAYKEAQRLYDEHLTRESLTWSSLDPSVRGDIQKWDIGTLIRTSEQLIQQGKDITTDIAAAKRELEHIADTQVQLEADIDRDTKALDTLQNDYQKKLEFFCTRIDENCPFIEQINSSLFRWLQKNIDDLKTTINTKQQKKETAISSGAMLDLTALIDKLTHERTTLLQHPIVKNNAAILATKQAYQERYTTKSAYEKSLRQSQQTRDALQSQSIRKAEREWQRWELVKQLTDLRSSLATQSNTNISGLRAQLSEQLSTSKSAATTLTAALLTYQRINDLIAQHTDSQRAIKSLREREVILTDLNRIFGKEIMIKVLEDSLPHFAEYINNILAKMVSFEIIFSPRKVTGDKLELEIIIRDEHGERNAKSLSGWQKAILKLAWTLGVAHMSRSEQLFLDETINNIDRATIHQVTMMLEDYFTMHDIPLYIITHSQQLQEMGLWDDVLTLE